MSCSGMVILRSGSWAVDGAVCGSQNMGSRKQSVRTIQITTTLLAYHVGYFQMACGKQSSSVMFLGCRWSSLWIAKHGKSQAVRTDHPNHYHIAGIPCGIFPNGLWEAIILSDEPSSWGCLSQHCRLHLQNRFAVSSQVLSKVCHSSNWNVSSIGTEQIGVSENGLSHF